MKQDYFLSWEGGALQGLWCTNVGLGAGSSEGGDWHGDMLLG